MPFKDDSLSWTFKVATNPNNLHYEASARCCSTSLAQQPKTSPSQHKVIGESGISSLRVPSTLVGTTTKWTIGSEFLFFQANTKNRVHWIKRCEQYFPSQWFSYETLKLFAGVLQRWHHDVADCYYVLLVSVSGNERLKMKIKKLKVLKLNVVNKKWNVYNKRYEYVQ